MSRGSNYPEGGTPASSQIIWLEKRVAELEEKLEEVSKDRDDWARKYQELHIIITKELKTYVKLLEKALVISEKDYEDLKKRNNNIASLGQGTALAFGLLAHQMS